jgi:hypothetical protein
MKFLKKMLLAIAVIIAIVLIIPLFIPKDYKVEKSININAPKDNDFNCIIIIGGTSKILLTQTIDRLKKSL